VARLNAKKLKNLGFLEHCTGQFRIVPADMSARISTMRMSDPCQYTRHHITSTFLSDLSADTDMRIGDTQIPGFHVRYSKKTERKVFYFWYKAKSTKKQYNVKLGLYPILTLADARKRASIMYGQVSAGKDPEHLRKEQECQQKQEDARAIPLSKVLDKYLEEYSKYNKKEKTYKSEKSIAKNHILPALGKLPINAITPEDIEKLKNKVGTKYKATANGIIALLSHFFNWCEIHKYIALNTNPCTHIKKYVLEGRDKVLPDDYYHKFYEALNYGRKLRQSDPVAFDIIEFIFLTGCRKGEAINLEWPWVDMDNSMLRLGKTKRGRRSIPIGEPALNLLKAAMARRKDNCPYVFPATATQKPFSDIKKPWAWLMKTIGLKDFNIHDLRHNFTTIGVLSGEDIAVVSKVLGHTNISTTQRYTHLNNLKGIEAANHISQKIIQKAKA